MHPTSRPPAGPRGTTGAAAEAAAAAHLVACGWTVLARNLRVGRNEVDIVARDPHPPTLVVVEVRARSRPGFGAALETVDGRKVARLYRAAGSLARNGHPGLVLAPGASAVWRVDLLTLRSGTAGEWRVEQHLRGLSPP
jgi:Holliday junction resolvase-like predicted endonuclease